MTRLLTILLAVGAITGLAACGSDDTNTSSGRAAFLKGCTNGDAGQFTDAQKKNFCNCAVDELSKRGLHTAGQLTDAEKKKTTAYTSAIQLCATKYLKPGA